ncbi:MAG: transposase [Candidatus Competibacteraceae bacterium]|nr:transposase [Candidatus Competibacteraceae bacterium]
MAKTEYSNEVKAAVMAALLEGQSISAVAKQYDIPKGTVSGWKQKALTPVANGGVVPDTTQKRQAIGDLLIGYLETMLRTLTVQAKHFGDVDWLKDQNANELAVLHGVATDKAIRLLEALAPSNEGGEE